MVIIAIMYNESVGALIRTQSAEPERALNEVAEWFARDLIEQGDCVRIKTTKGEQHGT